MKKNVYIFGLGFVGYPLMLLLANTKGKQKNLYNLTGVEASSEKRRKLSNFLKKGELPFITSDNKLKLLAKSKSSKKIKIVEHKELNEIQGIIIICINFDGLSKLNNLKKFFSNLCEKVRINSTIIIESTMIPGTCENILYPILKSKLKKKKINLNNVYFGFSYERIMPGNHYIDSIKNNFKSISGINKKSEDKIKRFYKTFLNYRNFPIYSFKKIVECETAKVMENSYRAVNISFIDEWNKFAEKNNLNLKDIIDSIKIRKSHSNLMRPGIGVGGYCLTKDPKFAEISSKKIFKKTVAFPLSKKALNINNKMPLFCFEFILSKMRSLKNKNILILGSSYKSDVSDVRLSPSIKLCEIMKKKKVNFINIDPLVNKNEFFKIYPKQLKKFDIVIFSVPHKFFKNFKINFVSRRTTIFDLDYVLNTYQIKNLKRNKVRVYSLGDYSE